MGIMDKAKQAIRAWLAIEPASDEGAITIRQPLSFDAYVLRNRIWYRGDASEIEQFFKAAGTGSETDTVNQSRFWASVSTNPIRKIHLDIPTQIVNRLSDIVVSDFAGFEIPDKDSEELWEEIATENKWQRFAKKSVDEALVTGDGAYKISVDPALSKYPIIEFYGADRVSFVSKRGRLQEVVFHTLYKNEHDRFRLDEHYATGSVKSELFKLGTREETLVPLTSIPETELILPSVTFTGDVMLAVPVQFTESAIWTGRGASILGTKTEAFDALDEVVSEWWDDFRKGRVKQFLPESMFPRDPNTTKLLRPSAFDDIFVATKDTMMEDGKMPGLFTYQPDIRSEAYLAGYAQALDMCLQGIISPSTMGIDMKKTDNAEAQREKEKATLWTRANIIDALSEAWPALVKAALVAAANMANKAPKDLEITCTFGEYSSPSFDQQLESMGVAAQWNLLSIEQTVEELYGDTKDDAWKKIEVQRLKELRGIMTVDEPGIGQVPNPAKPIFKEGKKDEPGKKPDDGSSGGPDEVAAVPAKAVPGKAGNKN